MQKKMLNAEWLNGLLPSNAPLSTMRVITTSSYSLKTVLDTRKVPDPAKKGDKETEENGDEQTADHSEEKEVKINF